MGRNHGTLARARLTSPTTATDTVAVIPGTDLSVMCFNVQNTSPFDARITAIGFDFPGEPLTGFSLISPPDSGFTLVDNGGNVPGFHDATLDFALVTGRSFSGGHPPSGLSPADPVVQFCVSGPFEDVSDELGLPVGVLPTIESLLDYGYVRFQRVGPDGEDGDVAIWERRFPIP